METSERILKNENFKTPLIIFDAVQIKKTEDKNLLPEEKKAEETVKKEVNNSSFLFPLSALF